MLLALLALCVSAAPAKPGTRKVLTLADGSAVTALLVGDEHGHYWLAEDGQAYLAVDGSEVYSPVDAEQIKSKAQQKRNQANTRRMRRMAPRRVGEVGGISGTKKGLIILVNFSNVSFKDENNNALYQLIANQANFSQGNFKGSMFDYFNAQSDGQFQLTFDVVGPVTVSKTQSYYGSNDTSGNDKHPAAMVIEALQLADSEVNYADYDWDKNGEVEQVYVVYAGKGEADGGAANTIWPHEWTLSSAKSYGDGTGAQTMDGVKIDTYACGAELNGLTGSIAGIGTMCHEFSHCLGYPDFYDTDYSGGQGMGSWDLMDGGSYNGDGYRPAGYTSYERWVAGWKTPVELTSTRQVNNLKSLQDGGESYIIYNPGNSNEYFLLENRQKRGWDADLPGAGLLILHVDYSASAWKNNTPNDDPSHQRMTWIPADNQYQYTTYEDTKYYTEAGMANDPYPYGSINSFGKTTTPAAKLFNKNTDNTYYLNTSVENITQNSDTYKTVSFKYKGLTTIAAPTFSPAAGRYDEAQTVSISCTAEGAVIYYTLDGTTPTTNSSVYSTPLTISATTTVKAMAVVDGDESDVVTAKYVIGSSASNPSTTTFKLVSSTDELEEGMRYVIACGSKNMAAGKTLTSGSSAAYLNNVSITSGNDNVITIGSDVTVFVLEGDQTDGWTLMNEETNQYLYASAAKKLAYSTDEKTWTLSNETAGGVIMTYGENGTMMYNVSYPRFTTYTSNATTSMIRANLYKEYTEPTTVDAPVISGTTPFDDMTTVTITAATGASIYYTLDGTTPTTSSTLYTAPFTLTATTTVTAIAVVGTTCSEVATMTFTANENTPSGSNIFRLVTSTSKLVDGARYIIACGSKSKAAGVLSGTYLTSVSVTVSDDDDEVTINDDVEVFTVEKDEDGYTFRNSEGNYLYATTTKKVNYTDESKVWELDDDEGAVIMTYGGCGTMLCNVTSPRFTTYTSSTSPTMVLANLYMEVLPTYELADDGFDNESLIEEYDSVLCNITLSERMLYQDGTWNTLCLPFDITVSSSVLENADVRELSSASFEGSTLTLNFTPVRTLIAGTPYIVKWNGNTAVSNPTFEGVRVKSTDLNDVDCGVVTFKGIFNSLSIEGEDRSMLYLGGNNLLYYPCAEMTLNAFRAYFVLNDGLVVGGDATTTGGVKNLVMNYTDETTGISLTPASSRGENGMWYTLDGRKVNRKSANGTMPKGIYVSGGRKMIVR